MTSGKSSISSNALQVASDPSASEERWMAACTILGDKELPAPGTEAVPKMIQMPWSLLVSSASAIGAVMLFTLLQVTLCLSVPGTGFSPSFVCLAFAGWYVPTIIFSMFFQYKKMLLKGGASWSVAQWLLIGGYLCAVSIWAIDGQPMKPADLGLLVFWNVTALAAAAIGVKIAQKSFNSLNSTVGIQRVLPYSLASFAVVPVIIAGYTLFGLVTNFFIPFEQVLFVLVGSIAFAGYVAALKNGASNPATAAALSTTVWSPFVYVNMTFLPILAVTHIWLLLTGTEMIALPDYIAGILAVAVSMSAPATGALIAAKQLQRRQAKQLGYATAGALSGGCLFPEVNQMKSCTFGGHLDSIDLVSDSKVDVPPDTQTSSQAS
jgi:hypothetical protein